MKQIFYSRSVPESFFTLPSFAKINLHLRVLRKGADGYHDIFTIFQTISLSDSLAFERKENGIELKCDDPRVPTDDSNLIIRAANALRTNCGVSVGAAICLNKQTPIGGGLGGGSSNAATALIGLSKLWHITANIYQLAEIAAELGADVPFFLHGGTAIGTGRGTIIESIDDFSAQHMLIVTPDVSVSTAKAYAELNAQNLTNEETNRILRVCRSEAESRDFLHSALKNDFEPTVFAAYPEIGRVKQTLIELGARQALMSGSGASVFGIFDKEETRQAALKALDIEVNWRKFAVATISRSSYRETLEQAF
jgi:4-diphosphocytidyl-2-C-methyl-D-erythritol kinase